MFSNRAFKTWPQIVVGAVVFGSLFMLVVMMAELVLDGMFRPSSGAVVLGLAALVGYIGLAVLIRRDEKEKARQ